MAAPTRELEKLIVSKKLAHGGNPVTRWMAANVAVAQDPAGNLKPAKDKSTERIDGIVALIMAIGRALVVRRSRSPRTRSLSCGSKGCCAPAPRCEDTQSRYIEAAVGGVLIACIYVPNGNPQPGQFDYKLAWFERLITRAAELHAAGVPALLAGDYNVVPTDLDIYPTKSWANDAHLLQQSRAAFQRLLEQGWTDEIRTLHPSDPMYTFWDYKRDRWRRDAGLRLDHLLLSPPLVRRLVQAGVDRARAGRGQ